MASDACWGKHEDILIRLLIFIEPLLLYIDDESLHALGEWV